MMTPVIVLLIAMLIPLSCMIGPLGFGGLSIMLFVFFRFSLRGIIRMAAIGGAKSVRDGSEAAVSANKRLRRVLERAVEPVACPKCNWYQSDMVSEIRARSYLWVNWLLIATVVLTLPIGYAAWEWHISDQWKVFSGYDPLVVTGVATAIAAILTVGTIIGLRWCMSLTLHPNRLFPSPPAPYPDAPSATLEEEWLRQMASQTARITASRQSPAAPATEPRRRIVPPRTK